MFVEDLCRLSDVIVFSAAVPHQGGTAHRSERWQSDWSGLFKQNGYDTFDLVRPRVWWDERVASYYRQNCLIYATDDAARPWGITPQLVLARRPGLLVGQNRDARDILRVMPTALRNRLAISCGRAKPSRNSLRRTSQSPPR